MTEREGGKRGKIRNPKSREIEPKEREKEKKNVRARDEDEDLCLDRSSSLSSANLLLLLSVIVFFFVELSYYWCKLAPSLLKKNTRQFVTLVLVWICDTSLNVSVHLQYLLIFLQKKLILILFILLHCVQLLYWSPMLYYYQSSRPIRFIHNIIGSSMMIPSPFPNSVLSYENAFNICLKWDNILSFLNLHLPISIQQQQPKILKIW